MDVTGQSVLQIGSTALTVTYPDELLEEATQKMLARDVGRLPVVSREDPTRLVGYLGRTGIMAAWLHVARDDSAREAGWLTQRLRTFGGILRRVPNGDSKPR
ncbi:MAG TPA: CBS domain-containing protein [Gemmatimonadales bacterium]|nr:CBS domain-containing protein [Gemmatimonadales bacterium]